MFNKSKNYFTDSKDGLSMTDAQSISNMCNQKAVTIESKLKAFNNYEKVLDMSTMPNATATEERMIRKVAGVKINDKEDIKSLLSKKARYHSLQAYLMEHLKLKESLIEEATSERDYGFVNPTYAELGLEPPVSIHSDEEYKALEPFIGLDEEERIDIIYKDLSASDLLELAINETKAAHFGTFIHKDGHLDKLRKELTKLPEFEIMEFPDKRSAVVLLKVHHTPDSLLEVHEAIADEHRNYERKVNAIKAKVKIAETELANSEITRQQVYKTALEKIQKRIAEVNSKINVDFQNAVNKLRGEHTIKCNNEITRIAKLKIAKPDAFTEIFGEYFTKK